MAAGTGPTDKRHLRVRLEEGVLTACEMNIDHGVFAGCGSERGRDWRAFHFGKELEEKTSTFVDMTWLLIRPGSSRKEGAGDQYPFLRAHTFAMCSS